MYSMPEEAHRLGTEPAFPPCKNFYIAMETIQQTLTAVMVKINYFIHKNVLFCSQQLDFVLKKVVYKAIN